MAPHKGNNAPHRNGNAPTGKDKAWDLLYSYNNPASNGLRDLAQAWAAYNITAHNIYIHIHNFWFLKVKYRIIKQTNIYIYITFSSNL